MLTVSVSVWPCLQSASFKHIVEFSSSIVGFICGREGKQCEAFIFGGFHDICRAFTTSYTAGSSGTECAQQYFMTWFHLLGIFGPLNASTLAPGEGLRLLTWMPGERCCSWDSALERCCGAGGSSCCVFDCHHHNEGGLKSGARCLG